MNLATRPHNPGERIRIAIRNLWCERNLELAERRLTTIGRFKRFKEVFDRYDVRWHDF